MPEKEKTLKAHMEKYAAVLNKFGLVPVFDFGKKEKKIVKYLLEVGSADFLSICDRFDLRPEKAHRHIDSLVAKGAIEYKEDTASLTPSCLSYLHTEKDERKSAKRFHKFVGTLSDKELDEFMKLISSFQIVPDAAPEEPAEEAKEEPAPAEEPKKAPRPRGRPKKEPSEAGEAKKAPAKRPLARKRRASRASKPRAKSPAKEPTTKEDINPNPEEGNPNG